MSKLRVHCPFFNAKDSRQASPMQKMLEQVVRFQWSADLKNCATTTENPRPQVRSRTRYRQGRGVEQGHGSKIERVRGKRRGGLREDVISSERGCVEDQPQHVQASSEQSRCCCD